MAQRQMVWVRGVSMGVEKPWVHALLPNNK
jgi:hypothetical protein